MRFASAFIVAALSLGWGASAQTAPAQNPAPRNSPVVGISRYSHAVASLDRTLSFYREVFGLTSESQPSPNLAPANSEAPAPRSALLRLPDAGFALALTESSAADSSQLRRTDPGATTLILSVSNLDPVFEALRRAAATIVTTSGVPVTIDPADSSLRSILIRDPDGYLVQVVQTPAAPSAAAAPGEASAHGNVHSAAIGLTVADLATNLQFYRDLLGFDLTHKMDFSSSKALLDLNGSPNAKFVVMSADVPGTKTNMEFYEFQGIPRTPVAPRAPGPGSPAVRLRVKGIEGVVARLRAAGIPNAAMVYQSGIVSVHTVFLTDPNGLTIELSEQTQ